MHCYVYKSSRRADTYVYLARRDDEGVLPAPLRQQLGALSLVLELDLSPERRLARADAANVMAQLADAGYYLQMPPQPERAD